MQFQTIYLRQAGIAAEGERLMLRGKAFVPRRSHIYNDRLDYLILKRGGVVEMLEKM